MSDWTRCDIEDCNAAFSGGPMPASWRHVAITEGTGQPLQLDYCSDEHLRAAMRIVADGID